MKFLVDAQLPPRLAVAIHAAGHPTIHTSALPDGNRSTDQQITEFADNEQRVVVTKDRDFRDSHLLTGRPAKLLIVATGNITNDALLALFDDALEALVDALDEYDLVELRPDALIAHPRRVR
ncbi:DUF5615 family PIN-like protein [Knoellia remsis]|uniref:DUF5615 family PIN-like protein n=1 Tax=Knoellia remsis TaxID=407159 RepID=UPI000D055018|nr:DUF5615 family PIN-like protein [Knoellia remsis]